MIDLRHQLAVLEQRMPWAQIEAALAPSFAREVRTGSRTEDVDLFGPRVELVGAGVSNPGRPRLPILLMAARLYLKHAFNLSDEELVIRWSENVVWQYFSGMDYYTPALPCDATQIGRFRKAIGEAGVEELLRARIDASVHDCRRAIQAGRRCGNASRDDDVIVGWSLYAVTQFAAALVKVSGICSATISPLAVATPSAKTVASTTTLRPLISFT